MDRASGGRQQKRWRRQNYLPRARGERSRTKKKKKKEKWEEGKRAIFVFDQRHSAMELRASYEPASWQAASVK